MGKPRAYDTGDGGPFPRPAHGSGAGLSGFPRPELLASTDWLGEHLDRPEIPIIDPRWRPRGNGAAAFASGHLPGPAHIDCQAGPSETGTDGQGPGLTLRSAAKV